MYAFEKSSRYTGPFFLLASCALASELYGTKNAMCILKIQNSVLKISAKIKIGILR